MSQYLDEVAQNLFQNRVPDAWATIYKSSKSLAPWSRDFKRRVLQL